jgi:hypothetical protein
MTKNFSNQLRLDVLKYNSQYPPNEIEFFFRFPRPFFDYCQYGALSYQSITEKHGKKWFTFS